MSFNLKRPKRLGEENEDDLIQFQEEFLKNKSVQPAATVIKKTKPSEILPDVKEADESRTRTAKQKIEIDCKI